MRATLLALAAALGTMAVPGLAHPDGHEEDRSERRPIAAIAKDSVVRLVTQARLPASWAKVEPLSRELRTRDGVQQWVITFRNEAERDRTKQMLYVIMSTSGSFISADHRLA